MAKGYSVGQIRLHWVVAALVVLQLALGGTMAEAARAYRLTGLAPMSAMAWAHVAGAWRFWS